MPHPSWNPVTRTHWVLVRDSPKVKCPSHDGHMAHLAVKGCIARLRCRDRIERTTMNEPPEGETRWRHLAISKSLSTPKAPNAKHGVCLAASNSAVPPGAHFRRHGNFREFPRQLDKHPQCKLGSVKGRNPLNVQGKSAKTG